MSSPIIDFNTGVRSPENPIGNHYKETDLIEPIVEHLKAELKRVNQKRLKKGKHPYHFVIHVRYTIDGQGDNDVLLEIDRFVVGDLEASNRRPNSIFGCKRLKGYKDHLKKYKDSGLIQVSIE
ncbi:MAG: hypothetical protein ACFFER_07315 [Candidatus Thorarchaeota archaeon]